MARHRQRHISGWLAILLLPVVVPIILVGALGTKLGLIKETADLTAEDVEGYITEFLAAGGGEWDWDDFTSIPITNPSLDGIRGEALYVRLPLTTQGEAKLQALLEQVRAM